MTKSRTMPARLVRLLLSILLGLSACALVLVIGRLPHSAVHAEALPGGIPKFILSTKTVTPTLTAPGDVTLTYHIRLVNTGAWTATAASLYDSLPTSTTYISGSLQPSGGAAIVQGGVLTWTGQVGFDSAVEITFGVRLNGAFTSGRVMNTAVVSDPMIAAPITLTTVTTVTNVPILSISKSSEPKLPGPNKPLFYTIRVSNNGQSAVDQPITVTDQVPLSTALRSIGPDGITGPISDTITWTRRVTLALGETTVFTFAVDVNNVPSGTVITNAKYQVTDPETGVTAGKPYTVTIVDPIFSLSKYTWPDPPGSNREMTYTLTLLNMGSLATDLVITDRVPSGVEYLRGGSEAGGVISWTLPRLDTGESAEFTYTVYISDVMDIPIVNGEYGVCSAEEICQPGSVVTSMIHGPTFEATVTLDPIAKKPGGGGGPVTPTLVVRNLGPGNAIDVQATLFFTRISVSANDLYVTPTVGTTPPFPDGPVCGSNCVSYVWVGSLGYGEAVTFTTHEGQSTIGGEEGTHYTTTVVITDSLSNTNTVPISGTAIGKITHFANVLPTKSAPAVIGRGQLLTYTIDVWNSALSTLLPPILTDTVPLSTTFIRASDGGVSSAISNTVMVSWTLPSMSPGDRIFRTFTVRVDNDMVSGTQIVNSAYAVFGYGNIVTGAVTSGPPVTTTVLEVGLIDSFKEVTPTLALPGPGNVLTYYLHIVNSSALSLTGVTVQDVLPWQSSTYQRDAIASAGHIVSDIVTIHWTGDVGPLSSEVVTFTVLVDPDYQGPVTNTAVISHPDLLKEVVVHAVAYITDRPELRITKSATPDPVERGAELAYTIHVVNLGQQATGLVITDTIPTNTIYITDSASAGGQLVGNMVHWELPVLKPGESRDIGFQVRVEEGREIINDRYAVSCAEGVTAIGEPVVTRVTGGGRIYLPIIMKHS